MGRIIKLYNTWEKVKDIFVKPSLKVYFGKWKNDPNLPVWRRGPQFLQFHIFNYDVCWKPKWDECRYEFPPQFSIIAFGYSLSFTLHGPKCRFGCDDNYWESILNYLYNNKSNTLEEAIQNVGVWTQYKNDDCVKFFGVRPEYITSAYIEEYYGIVSTIKRQKEEIIL